MIATFALSSLRRAGACCMALLAALLWANVVAAAPNYRALLVGVTTYPSLSKDEQLEGPANDVARMRELLLQRGVPEANIAVLAEAGGPAAWPTRANILAQLDRLARTARPNDYIILQMAGHGSQAPVPPGHPLAGEEPDGLFEIFLPRDVGKWTNPPGGVGAAVENAIHDHEIRAAVDRMTAAGAFMWALFDACHSATLVRSAGAGSDEVRLRQVTPASLGVPASALDAAAAAARVTAPARSAATARPRGGSAFFYAAQTIEPTPEMRLPLGHPQRQPYGLFTFMVLQALESGVGMTYRQLAQYVLTRYGAINEVRATPLFSGTALDAPVFGQAAAPVAQWRLLEGSGLAMGGGALADVQEGAIVAILPTPIARLQERLGYAVVTRTDLTRAELRAVDHAGFAARSDAALKAGAVARLVQPAVSFVLNVAQDLSQCADPCLFRPALEQLVEASRAQGAVGGARVAWAGPGQSADLRLVASGNRLWLMPPSLAGQTACTREQGTARQACLTRLERSVVSITAEATATPDKIAEALAAALHGVARSANLMRLANVLGQNAAGKQVRVAVELVARNGRKTAYQPGQVPRLADGDRIIVTLENSGRTAVDVTALYLDSRYGVSAVFPGAQGESNRLEARGKTRFELEVSDETLGTERLMVIAAAVQAKAERADFSFLAQSTLANVTLRSVGNAGTTDLFRDAGFAALATRAAARPAPVAGNTTGMQVFSWQVVR